MFGTGNEEQRNILSTYMDSGKRDRKERISTTWNGGKEIFMLVERLQLEHEGDVWRRDWGHEDFAEIMLWLPKNTSAGFRELEKGMRRTHFREWGEPELGV